VQKRENRCKIFALRLVSATGIRGGNPTRANIQHEADDDDDDCIFCKETCGKRFVIFVEDTPIKLKLNGRTNRQRTYRL